MRHTGSPNIGGGEGAQIQHDVATTLACSQDQTVFTPAAYSIAANIIGRAPENGGQFGSNAIEECSFTLTAGGGPPAVVALDHSVCFVQNSRDEVRFMGGDGTLAGALTATRFGDKQQNVILESRELPTILCIANENTNAEIMVDCSPTQVARQSKGAPIVCVGDDNAHASVDFDLSGSLKVGGSPSYIATTMVVRRLMPIECERLQGFPDNWTKIAYKGKSEDECPDSHRYMVCGNSMAVPVMRWIGRRIQMVDDLTEAADA